MLSINAPDCFRLRLKSEGMRGYSSVAGGGGGGWGSTPYNGLYGEAPPERGIFYSQTPLIPDTKGAIESVRIKRVEFRGKLSIMMRCKAVFDCI